MGGAFRVIINKPRRHILMAAWFGDKEKTEYPMEDLPYRSDLSSIVAFTRTKFSHACNPLICREGSTHR